MEEWTFATIYERFEGTEKNQKTKLLFLHRWGAVFAEGFDKTVSNLARKLFLRKLGWMDLLKEIVNKKPGKQNILQSKEHQFKPFYQRLKDKNAHIYQKKVRRNNQISKW